MQYKMVEIQFDLYGKWFDHVSENLRVSEMVDNKLKSNAGELIACWDADQDSGWVSYGTFVA